MKSTLLLAFFSLWCSRLTQARTLSTADQSYTEADLLRADSEPSESSLHHHSKRQTLTWKFPEDPAEPVKKLPPAFRVQQPTVKRDRVGLRCGQNKIQVEVSQDLLGIGRLVRPKELTLGGCPPVEVDQLAQVLVFESELHSCGSRLVMTEAAFIYAFVLVYQPEALATITRSQRVVVGVECHYTR